MSDYELKMFILLWRVLIFKITDHVAYLAEHRLPRTL